MDDGKTFHTIVEGYQATEAAQHARQGIERRYLFEKASAAVRSDMLRLRKVLSPEKPVDPETLSKADRLRWEAFVTGEAVNSRVLTQAAPGVALETMVRTTGIPRQTPPGPERVRSSERGSSGPCGEQVTAWIVAMKNDHAVGDEPPKGHDPPRDPMADGDLMEDLQTGPRPRKPVERCGERS